MRRTETSLDAVIGLGANLGDGRATFRATLTELAALGTLTAVSALYQTLPVGGPPQPDFLNAAVRLHCAADPEALLEQLLGIERRSGRMRVERWGPRTLDLDILWIKGVRHESPGLRVPHPRLRERAFALWPLLDVAPDASDPDTGVTYRALAEKVGRGGLWRVEGSWGQGPAPCGSGEA